MTLNNLRQTLKHKGLKSVLLLCLSVLLMFGVAAQNDEYPQLPKRDKLVAAYLFNFTKFIEWPDFSGRDPRSEIIICLQENSKIYGFISELVSGRKVGTRQLPVELRVFGPDERCDMVYVEQANFFEQSGFANDVDNAAVQERLQEVLIVASNADLYPESTAISFYEQKKRLRFEVNMNKINSLKLKVRSELLKLARIKQ